MIIIPDVHGRVFWKEAVQKALPNEKIVFLGDYVDPYPWENLDGDDVLQNFKEIIEFKKQNSEKCTLLLGNHDCEYFMNTTPCRYMRKHARDIKQLFMDNLELFNIIKLYTIAGKNYTFSHAPITQGWIKDVVDFGWIECSTTELNNIAEVLNKQLHSDYTFLRKPLDMYGFCRGGYNDFPSPIWCDVREISETEQFPRTYEIFGHTQLQSEIITDNYACLDCRRVFRLDEETGAIEAITPEVKIEV